MKLNKYEELHEERNNVDEKILKVYNYGSRVYGCHTEKSDYDKIIIVESDNDNLYYSVNMTNLNITVYSEALFIKKIQEHRIDALECIFQDKNDPYLKYFELDKEKLRRAISAVSSNSFVKCKKKLAQGDVYIGKKSLFHSLRILGFGIQIALTGKIVNYSYYNKYLTEIMSMGDDWEELKAKYQPIYNKAKSNFKLYAPLEEENNAK
jgi:predicted nucleotidyltransferase